MSTPSTSEVLNRLLVLHSRSLPMYLSYAAPHALAEHPRFKETLEAIVGCHKRLVDRLAHLILENHGTTDPGEFPMTFTGLHDLSVEYLQKLVIERQRKEIAYIGRCVDLLKLAPFAQAIAQEALGEAKAHLQSLEELSAAPAA